LERINLERINLERINLDESTLTMGLLERVAAAAPCRRLRSGVTRSPWKFNSPGPLGTGVPLDNGTQMLGIFRNRQRDALVSRLYGEIAAQARHPKLYLDYAVPDTIEGRYDMMVLHAFLALRRLGQGDEDNRRLAQELCDRFFTEMDRAFREMGVGDLGVPKRMQSIAEVYAGASGAYAAALEEGGDGISGAALVSALSRNVYDGDAGADHAIRLADYVRSCERRLAATSLSTLVEQGLAFESPQAADGAVHDRA
jgi:cytochrome b pre-mRNA-processing protein 3